MVMGLCALPRLFSLVKATQTAVSESPLLGRGRGRLPLLTMQRYYIPFWHHD